MRDSRNGALSKPDYYVVSFSGGKDSTAMLLRLLEEGMPVDMVLFCDTGLEFPQMYDHIRKVEKNTGKKITIVKSEESFEYLFAYKPIKIKPESKLSQKYGAQRIGYGWAGPQLRWCTRDLKSRPRERFLSPLKKQYNVIEYVGLAADETQRLERKSNQRPSIHLPLVSWGMTEKDCLQYCYERGYDWGGLYTLMKRVSCWCCPLQGLSELRVLRDRFPDLWKQLQAWDQMTWRQFKSTYSVKDLDIRFDLEKEFLASGKPVKDRAFFVALKKKIEESR